MWVPQAWGFWPNPSPHCKPTPRIARLNRTPIEYSCRLATPQAKIGKRQMQRPYPAFASSFFYAGARALLVSHWAVLICSGIEMTINLASKSTTIG